MTATFADRALPLAAQGTPCFPCGSNKAPLVSGGFKAATTDAATLSAWSRKHPTALVGVPTGGDSFVLDVDTGPDHAADGFATLAQHGRALPATRCNHTRSGGRHYFFRTPPGQTIKSSAGKLGPGLDVRGEGGYIVDWRASIDAPAENEDILADAPDWLLAALADSPKLSTPAAVPPAMAAAVDNSALWAGLYPALTPSRTVTLLAAISPDCPYDQWVLVAFALKAELGEDGLRYWVAWSSRGDKFPGAGPLIRKWRTFAGDRMTGPTVTAGTLVALANANKKEAAHVG